VEIERLLGLLIWEFVGQFTGELVDVGGLAESLDLNGRGLHVDARVLTQPLQHLENHGEFLFGEHADLQIEMRAALGLASHAILADEHENGEENTLGRNKKRQHAEGKRIEGFYTGNEVEIHRTPDSNQD
jgi:hypothetical protein